MKKLLNKVAIVTGASKGIGASIAKHLAAEGASVIVNYLSGRSGADSVVEQIVKAGGKAAAVQADISKKQEIENLFSEASKLFGGLDILVNNAGVYEFGALEELSEDHFYKMFNINVLGLLLASQEALKYFGSNGGSIINISSIVSTYAPAFTAAYSATKGAVDSITKSLAKELGGRKIRVNSINPGMVETEGTVVSGISSGEMRRNVESSTPLGRIGQPDDIAPAVVFLASEDSAWLTGESIFISGGLR